MAAGETGSYLHVPGPVLGESRQRMEMDEQGLVCADVRKQAS